MAPRLRAAPVHGRSRPHLPSHRRARRRRDHCLSGGHRLLHDIALVLRRDDAATRSGNRDHARADLVVHHAHAFRAACRAAGPRATLWRHARRSLFHHARHAYWDRVTRALIEGVKEARAKLEPARLGVGIGEARANINRRELRDGRIVLGENPEGPVDRQLGLIRLERPDGSPIGLIANYAIHGTCLHGGNTQISGDAPGWVSQYVESKLGVPLLFVNGAEGNVAPFPTVGNDITDPRIKSFENTLGDPILALNASIQECASDVSLRLSQTDIVTPRKEGLGWIEELADYARIVDGVDHVRIPIRGLVINSDTAIWAAPLELFSEIAINIRQASPYARTMYFGLTNGSLLYLPTKAPPEGASEPNVSPFREQAEEDLTSGVSAWLTGLK